MNNSNSTIVGNIVDDIELRYIASGTAVANLRVAVNHRRKVGDQWEDEASFITVTAWADLAENVAQSLVKGSRIIAAGRIAQRSWENADGEKRSTIELVADAIGAELRFATVQVDRVERAKPSGAAGGNADRLAPLPDEEPFVCEATIGDIEAVSNRAW